MFFLILFFVLIAVLIESVLPILPLTLLLLLLYTVLQQDSRVFPLALGAGLLLDLLLLRPLGSTALYFLCFLLLVLLYKRKYEIRTIPFVLASSLVGSLFFLLIFGYSGVLLGVSLSVFVTLVVFVAIRLLEKKESSI